VTPAEVRQRLVAALEADLVGPFLDDGGDDGGAGHLGPGEPVGGVVFRADIGGLNGHADLVLFVGRTKGESWPLPVMMRI